MYSLYALPSMLSSGFTSNFRFMTIIILYMLRSCYTNCILFHQSPAISYYTMSVLCFISLVISLLAPICLCYRHSFQCMFMIRIYRYTCAYLCMPFGISITTRWGVLTPLVHMSRSRGLELMDSPCC